MAGRRTARWFAVGLLAASCSSPASYERPIIDLPATTEPSPQADDPAAFPVPAGAVLVTRDDDLAELVAQAPAGATVVIAPGVHRTGPVEPKNGMTFLGSAGTVLSGAAVVSGFSPSGAYWEFAGVPLDAERHGVCIAGYAACELRNDLYMDDVMLWRADSADGLESGEWWGEGDRVLIADDPTNRVVELSVASHAFVGDADNVTIDGLTVEKYAVPAQDAAIQSVNAQHDGAGSGWIIKNVEARLNHAAGVRAGINTQMRNIHSHHNGQTGIVGNAGTDVLLEDSEIAHNNTRGFFWEWEAGGTKFTETTGLVIRNVFVHDNLGPGLWTDIDVVDATIESNTVTDNAGPGIFHEISGAALIRDNDVRRNGFSKAFWAWGAGILVAGSSDVEVVGNRVLDNADGIAGIQQDRGEGPDGPYLLARLFVHDNQISLSAGTMGVVQDNADNDVFTDRGIRFEGNDYTAVGDRRAYAWDNETLNRFGWVDAGQDITGTWR